MSERRIAAIDIGTVTTRLLIGDVNATDAGVRIDEVERSTDITHLGEGLTRTGKLSEAAMQRVADVIGRYADTMRRRGVEAHTAVATSASRDAANARDFLGLLQSRGVRPEIVSGDREAALVFGGATFGMQGTGLLVVDVGGGSTELIAGAAGTGARVDLARSIDIGSRRLTELHLRADPPRPEELAAARETARTMLAPYFEALAAGPRQMIAVAGTATTLAAIRLGMPTPEYDPARVQGFTLTAEALSHLLDTLAVLPLAERREVVGLHPERAPVIVAGVVVLGVVLELSGLDSTVVSDRDILYGILLDTYRRFS